MAENRPGSKNGRESSPLWANVGSSGFNTGQIPLLVPFNTGPEPAVLADAGEADHFLGQDSPPSLTPVTRSDSSVALFATETTNDSFRVGFGPAPLSAASDALQNLSTETTTAAPSQPPAEQNPPAVDERSQFEEIPSVAPSADGYFQTPASTTVSSVPMYNPSQAVPPTTQPATVTPYSPVDPHWYYCKQVADQANWVSFSHLDSMTLEESFLNGEPEVIQTDGGRYDVHITERQRQAVYWTEEPCEIRRCSWFYRDDSTMKYIPYSELIAEELEEVYMQTTQENSWHKRNELKNSRDIFVFHSPHVFVQFSRGSFPDDFGAPFSEMPRPKVVKRGTDGLDPITNGEPQQIDELVFVVHGIGPVCDLRFRNIVECVDDMRNTGMNIVSSHFRTAKSNNQLGRVEFIPIYWYDALRNDAVGVDKRLGNITLPSIAKIRELTNEVLLDILFYNSPLYSQSILDRVGGELNRLHSIFMQRNPGWKGKISLAGHSLGSLVLFDLLSMQGVQPAPSAQPEPIPAAVSQARTSTPASEVTSERSNTATPVDSKLETIETMETVLEHLALTNLSSKFNDEQIDLESLLMCSEDDLKSIGLPLGPRKKILKFVAEREAKMAAKTEPTQQEPVAVVSPVELVPALESTPSQHSWLVESASNTQVGYVSGLQGVGFPLVQYPQLNFHVSKFFALGSPIAVFLTIRGVENLSRDFQLPTCSSLFNIFHPFDPIAYRLEPLINPDIKQKPVLMPHHKGRKRLHLELKENIVKVGADIKDRVMRSLKNTWASINHFARAHTSSTTDDLSQEVDKAIESVVHGEDKLDTSHSELESVSSIAEGEVEVGMLNQGRRIDYVLQEAPFESFNDYLFALSSHLVYWESEDVSLMMMKEIYAPLGVTPDMKEKQANSVSRNNSRMFNAGEQDPSQLPAAGVSSYPNQPPLSGPSYPSQPPPGGYPSQPPPGGYPSQPPPGGYPSQPPPGGYPSQPPSGGYPSQTPATGAAYPSQPPMSAMGQQAPVPTSISGPPPRSGFVPSGPPRAGFLPRH